MIVKANGPKCNCGNSGCLEAISSRTAITKKIRKAVLKQGRKSHILELNGGNLDNIRSKTLAKAVASGDKVTIKVIRRTAKYLGIGIASVVNFLNPEMIILGGGVVEALDDEFIKRIRKFAKCVKSNDLFLVGLLGKDFSHDLFISRALSIKHVKWECLHLTRQNS